MKTSLLTTRRVLAATGALAVAGGMAAAGAGMAHAGTVPVNHPDEPTVAMTLTNHTNKTEYLTYANPGAGEFVNGPRHTLAPGASEIVVAAAPHSKSQDVLVKYRIGAVGPQAVYELQNVRGAVNTNATGTTGGHYFVDANISTGFPNVNVAYDLW